MAAQDHRSDFVRRLFAITVSVGFAGAIASSEWARQHRLPAPQELEPLTLLLAGLALIIGSWERYHQSIKTDHSIWMFFFDVGIVLSYLLLLLLSPSPILFLLCLCLVYAMYCVWWGLVLLEKLHPVGEAIPRLVSTALWLGFFSVTAWRWHLEPASTWALGVLVTAAIVLYRWKHTKRIFGTIVSVSLLGLVQLLM